MSMKQTIYFPGSLDHSTTQILLLIHVSDLMFAFHEEEIFFSWILHK